jgi:hypothetical protein
LKRITELSRVDYIWLKFDTHVIEVWSYQERYLAKAVRMLNRRITGLMPPEKVVEKGPENTVIETWNECDVSFTHRENVCSFETSQVPPKHRVHNHGQGERLFKSVRKDPQGVSVQPVFHEDAEQGKQRRQRSHSYKSDPLGF